jgi:hypothetical protein
MASGKYEYLSQKILNYIFGGGAFSQPATLWLALFTVAPTISTTGTEATGGGYARVAITCNTTNWPAISGSTTTLTNGAAFTFPAGTGSGYSAGANMTDAGFFDAVTAGNLLYWGDLTVAKPVLSADTPSFAASAITVQEL